MMMVSQKVAWLVDNLVELTVVLSVDYLADCLVVEMVGL